MPSPILIFGDKYLSKNDIIAAKKKYAKARWTTKSAANDSLNSIRMETGVSSWDDNEDKIILIEDIPNRKEVREFILDLSVSCPSGTKLIIWDSNGHIKINPKTKTFDKTWGDFVSAFKKITGNKVINHGSELTEKDNEDSTAFIKKLFEKKGYTIGNNEIRVLIDIIGHDRGMLSSDIDKMCLTAPSNITIDFIIDNAFPSSNEAVQYKLANIMDNGSYEDALNMMDRFIEIGTNPNVIAEICIRKARWQMVATYLWVRGLSWNEVVDKIMEMGKFPSSIWHNSNFTFSDKKAAALQFQSPEQILFYMTRHLKGLPDYYFKPSHDIKTKKALKESGTITRKGAEIMPLPFMAEQVVSFVRDKVVRANNISTAEEKERLLDRAIKVYLIAQDKLAEIRYGENPVQDLQEIVRVIMNVNLECF
jgi:hypothetical protein